MLANAWTTFWSDVWGFFVHHPHPVQLIRNIVSVPFFIIVIGMWLSARHRSKKRSEEDEQEMIDEKFEKNEEGLYPWEVDTDDSPDRIKAEHKPIDMDFLPKRGRWR